MKVSVSAVLVVVLAIVVARTCATPSLSPYVSINSEAFADKAGRKPASTEAGKSLRLADFPVIEWTDLMPEEDLKKMESLPEVDHGNIAEDDSTITPGRIRDAIAKSMDEQWQEVMTSSKVRSELDHKRIRLPGFIVPVSIDMDKVMTVTKFFFVPFFGACIHVPPPPPNQILYVRYPKGVTLSDLYTAYWIAGELRVEKTDNDIALAAYAMDADLVEIYAGE